MEQGLDTETLFLDFVRGYRGGDRLDRFVANIPEGVLNADYYFPDENVIVELKTLEKDALDGEELARRISNAFQHFGYSYEIYLDWLFRRINLPPEVEKRFFASISRPIRECVKKAGKQIVSSRQLLGKPNASGIILISNKGNFGLEAIQICEVINRAFDEVRERKLGSAVYFSTEVHYDLGDGLPRQIWVPVVNLAGDNLQKFIDDLGSAWFDFEDARNGQRLDRQVGQDFARLVEARLVHRNQE